MDDINSVKDSIKDIQNQIRIFLYQVDGSIGNISPDVIEEYLDLVKRDTGIQNMKDLTKEIVSQYDYLEELIDISNRRFLEKILWFYKINDGIVMKMVSMIYI